MWMLDSDGCRESIRQRRKLVEGSWTDKISVQVHDTAIPDFELAAEAYRYRNELVYLRVDGNIVKVKQGFNLWGSSDVLGLAAELVDFALEAIGLGRGSGAVAYLDRGYFNRIDATWSFDLGSQSAASSLVRQLGKLASVSHRRASCFASSMVFPGRRSSLSIYHKGPEMRAHPPKRDLPGMVEFADRVVRFEVLHRSESLSELDCRKVSSWLDKSQTECLFGLWWSFVKKLRFPVMADIDLSKLSKASSRIYSVWLSGHDPHAVASQATLYRHRTAILKAGGPDILLPKPDGDVVQFRRVLTPVPAVPPAEFAALIWRPAA